MVLLPISLEHIPTKLNHSLHLNVNSQRNHNNLPNNVPQQQLPDTL